PAPIPAPRPVPAPVPHHGPAPDYRPGHHGLFHSRPFERDYYRSWRFLRSHDFFRFDVLPSTLQIAMRNFTATEFDLEENSTTGYSWFARYDSTYCNVAITHYAPAGFGIVGNPGKANIRITAKYPGDTLVEFIYARRWEWEQGAAPDKVIQLFVHVDP
ncbi:MAG: protease inhibitor I42 family protein, partial [Victivallales bacterium]|nr:protease inhibitor I42 family protein [Victivallales bacterium]